MATRPQISTPQGAPHNIGLWLNTPNADGQTTGKHVLWGKIDGVKTRAYLNRNKSTGEAFLTFSNMEADKDANGWFQKIANGRLVKGEDGALQLNFSMLANKETVLAAADLTAEEAEKLGYDANAVAAPKAARPTAAAPAPTAPRPAAQPAGFDDDDVPF